MAIGGMVGARGTFIYLDPASHSGHWSRASGTITENEIVKRSYPRPEAGVAVPTLPRQTSRACIILSLVSLIARSVIRSVLVARIPASLCSTHSRSIARALMILWLTISNGITVVYLTALPSLSNLYLIARFDPR